MSAPATRPQAGQTLAGPLLVALGALAIGFAPIGLRLSEFGPQATAFWRYIFALPVLVVLAHRAGGVGRPSPWAIAAGVAFGLDMVLWHAALTMTSVANATFIVNLGAVGSALVAWMALKQAPPRIWPAAALLALAGAWMLSRGAGHAGPAGVTGDLLALAAAGFVAGYIVLSMIARQHDRAMSAMVWATLSATGVALVATLVMREPLVPAHWTWLIAPAALGIIAHAMGQGLIMSGLGKTPASLAGILMLIQPVASALVAWRLFDEPLGALQLAGCALILAGVWLASRR
jgi:drug/metabolite transporter (DMT)-like permease